MGNGHLDAVRGGVTLCGGGSRVRYSTPIYGGAGEAGRGLETPIEISASAGSIRLLDAT